MGVGGTDADFVSDAAAAVVSTLRSSHAGAARTYERRGNHFIFAVGPHIAKIVIYRNPSEQLAFTNEVSVHLHMTREAGAHVLRAVGTCTLALYHGVLLMERAEVVLHALLTQAPDPLAYHTAWWPRIAVAVRVVVDAMAAAGVAHMDLRPDNVAVSVKADGRMSAKVFDFGHAVVSDGQWPLTHVSLPPDVPDYDALFFVWHYALVMRERCGAWVPIRDGMALPSLAEARAAFDALGAKYKWQS